MITTRIINKEKHDDDKNSDDERWWYMANIWTLSRNTLFIYEILLTSLSERYVALIEE